ncbi:MAG: hypothetical protein IJZ95_08985 [Oscillospiraceae bacterium]|nr:hypothetical protein [Oscillospiraceae bacterium]
MKSIRSLFYREMRLSARHYIIRFLLLVLVVGFAALSLLVTGQNSAHTGEDMSGFTVMLTYIIAVVAGVVISEDNGVFKADMDAGWLRYSYALPMSAAKKALTRTLVKLLSVAVGMAVTVAGAAAVCAMNGSSLDLTTILNFVLILDIFLLYDMVQQIFILRATDADELKRNKLIGGVVGVGAILLVTEFLPIDISGLEKAMELIPEMKSPAEMSQLGELFELPEIVGYFGIPAMLVILGVGFFASWKALERRPD